MDRAPLDDALAGMVMVKLNLVYGRRFANSYEASPEQVRRHWAQELAGMTEEGVRYALEHLPADYVPNVLQFRLIAAGRPPAAFKALPAPQASPDRQQRALSALQALRGAMAAPRLGVDIEWARRIAREPDGKSYRARQLAREVLVAHGELAE